MKKIRIVLLSVLLGLMLCACGEEEPLSSIDQGRVDNVISIINDTEIVDILSEMGQNPQFIEQVFGVKADYDSLTPDELSSFVYTLSSSVAQYHYSSGYIRADGYVIANAVSSFRRGFAETGAILEKGQPVAHMNGNEIIVDVPVICENREAEIEFIFRNDLTNPEMLSASLNAEYSMAEKMEKAGLNTVIGMGTVFVMLILISFIISLFGLFSGHGKKPDKTEESINKAVEQIEKNETAELASNEELVAVIAAAIAAYEGTSNTNGFTVRSIKKIKRQ
ncbi:MAG: OadG family protein [Lachnospiraceae bacterium]|nr:OadG family protein [Lachnospiraceae bacterium]